MARFAACLAALAFGLAAPPTIGQEAVGLFSKTPYLQGPGAETITIMWESLTNLPGTVCFGTAGKLDQQIEGVRPRQLRGVSSVSRTDIALVPRTNVVSGVGETIVWQTKTNVTSVSVTNAFYLYEATLEGLKPGSAYYYTVELDGTRTPARRFKTLPTDPSKARFVAYGDTRTLPRVHAAVARRIRDQAPDFILHTGDLVANGKDYARWSKEFFTPLTGVIDETPLFPVIGNHEEDGTNYLAYFHLPGKELWYSFDAGPVHVLALDFRQEKAAHEQFQFASQDLRSSRAPWKFVVLHYPVFNIGGHGTGWGHESYLPLFHETKVDFVLAGHSHVYERFRPVASAAGPDTWPITCITTGGGGAPLYQSFDHPALMRRSTTNHYMVFEVTADTLRGRATDLQGRVLDRFELRKTNGQLPRSYLAQVYSEELLKLVFEIAPSLAGKAAALPTPSAAAAVTLKLVPRKKSSAPVELEIGLAPDSARYYVLDNGPLHAVTPPSGVTNQVAVALVRATGAKKITGDPGKELAPPLIFQARIKTDNGETLSYGAKSERSKPPSPPTPPAKAP